MQSVTVKQFTLSGEIDAPHPPPAPVRSKVSSGNAAGREEGDKRRGQKLMAARERNCAKRQAKIKISLPLTFPHLAMTQLSVSISSAMHSLPALQPSRCLVRRP